MKRIVAAGFLVVCATTPVSAKGITTKIVISGGELTAPIQVSDPELLKNFNVWAGAGTRVNGVEQTDGFIINWIAGAVADPPGGLDAYEVSFYVKYTNRPAWEQEDHLAYLVIYQRNRSTGQGYVYLPGKADAWYRLNTRAVLRGGEGHWFRATAVWQEVFGRLVAPLGR
jgi:hypothetical protein